MWSIVLMMYKTDIGDSWERRRRPGLLHRIRAETLRRRDQPLSVRRDSSSPGFTIVAVLLLSMGGAAFAETSDDDTRTQYPRALQNSYIAVNVGTIDQPFSQVQLQPGFRAAAIDVPRVDTSVVLFGHEFNRFVSAQASYMRPVKYVTYTAVRPGDTAAHDVRVNFGALTLRWREPVRGPWSAYGEGGLGLTSRTGFRLGGPRAVMDAHYPSVLVGSGVEYRLTPSWDLIGGVTFSPGNASVSQPRTIYASGGLRYTMRPLPPDRVEANRDSGFRFPRQIVQIEYSSGTGYGVNNFVSRKIPVFWGGHAQVDFGIAPHYERNVFHTSRTFALDLGVGAGFYKTQQNDDRFYTLSLYPLFRFMFLRARLTDMYFAYSLAGPTYISRTMLDEADTGHHFTFQDFMGIGWFAGRNRNLNVGVKINHYSNGNIFTQNAGVKIPLTLSLGYAF
jgi:Lipid A 3-O-deacylase (PagL)